MWQQEGLQDLLAKRIIEESGLKRHILGELSPEVHCNNFMTTYPRRLKWTSSKGRSEVSARVLSIFCVLHKRNDGVLMPDESLLLQSRFEGWDNTGLLSFGLAAPNIDWGTYWRVTNSRVAINYRRSLHSFQFLPKKIFWTTKRRRCPRRSFNPHLHVAPISRCRVSRDRYEQIVREEFSAAVNQWHDPISGHFPFKRKRTCSNCGIHTFVIFVFITILCSAIKETLCNHLCFS